MSRMSCQRESLSSYSAMTASRLTAAIASSAVSESVANRTSQPLVT